jgi:uncharacterized membrane protein YphA (DoxX/SURF4 family)
MRAGCGGEKPLDLGVQAQVENASFITGTLPCPRRLWLQKLFSTFPEGWPGIGLVLMRLTIAFSAFVQGANKLIESHAQIFACAIGSLEILVGAALMIGFLTPVAGACASLCNLANSVSWFLTSGGKGDAIVSIYLVVICIAITLLGPGAFSLDGRLFGRREIIIPGRSRPPFQ